MVRHLRIRDFVPPGMHFHLAAPIIISTRKPDNEHDHDFHEIFYVEAGLGWHWINGERRPLVPASLVLVRDTDAHALTAEAENVQIANIAFSKKYWNQILSRYFSANPDPMNLPVSQRTRIMAADDHQHLRQLCAECRGPTEPGHIWIIFSSRCSGCGPGFEQPPTRRPRCRSG